MKFYILLALAIFANVVPDDVKGANILVYMAFASHSHRIGIEKIMEKLADRGHKITYFFTLPKPTNSSYPGVYEAGNIENIMEKMEAKGLPAIDMLSIRMKEGPSGIAKTWPVLPEIGVKLCEIQLEDPGIREWLDKSSFDLVIIDMLYNDCGYGFAYKFKAPYIVYSSTAAMPWWQDAYGYPDENSYYPEVQYAFPAGEMTLLQRAFNILRPFYWQFIRNYYMFPNIEHTFRANMKGFEDMPPLAEMDKNVSLLMIQSDFTEAYPNSYPPQVVSIPGAHIKKQPSKLPKDLEAFIDKGGKGFVYVSFGTFATFQNAEFLASIFINAFKSHPDIQFIWKWDGASLKDKPANLYTSNWLPQQDILAHPKIRAFITHAGLMSTQEAVYYAVPTIIAPLFAEQDLNAKRAVAQGRSISIEFYRIESSTLDSAIKEMLSNPKYKKAAQRASAIFKDRMNDPVDKGAWWIEYVLRHKGNTFHLRSYGIHQTWWQRRALDAWALIFLGPICAIYLSFKILAAIRKCFSDEKEKKTTRSGKKYK